MILVEPPGRCLRLAPGPGDLKSGNDSFKAFRFQMIPKDEGFNVYS